MIDDGAGEHWIFGIWKKNGEKSADTTTLIMIDSGSFSHVCTPDAFPEVVLRYGPPMNAVAATRSKIKHFGVKSVHGAVFVKGWSCADDDD